VSLRACLHGRGYVRIYTSLNTALRCPGSRAIQNRANILATFIHMYVYIFISGKACKFIVVTTNAGHGTLNVIIQGPSRTAIICTELDEGYEFTYTPMAPGDYLINIKYCNVTIAGCPTKASVTGRLQVYCLINYCKRNRKVNYMKRNA